MNTLFSNLPLDLIKELSRILHGLHFCIVLKELRIMTRQVRLTLNREHPIYEDDFFNISCGISYRVHLHEYYILFIPRWQIVHKMDHSKIESIYSFTKELEGKMYGMVPFCSSYLNKMVYP